MAQYVQQFQAFDFAMSMGKSPTEVMVDFCLTEEQYNRAVEFWNAGNSLELEKLLSSCSKTAGVDEPALPVVELVQEEKPEFGYKATPRKSYMFVKPLPPTHKGRLITPKAYESTSDMGFVHEAGPDVTDVKKGDLVLFDKYAEVGNRFDLVDDEGEIVSLVQMREDNVTAVLQRVKLDV